MKNNIKLPKASLSLSPMVYDYLILGGGASGLSLVHRMADHPWVSDKRIGIIERKKKVVNDRTWCFWEAKEGKYNEILNKKWSQLDFHSSVLSKRIDISPYSYKMIKGIDFYNHVYTAISNKKNVDIIYDEIITFSEGVAHVSVTCKGKTYKANHIFKSFPDKSIDYSDHHYVDQHFKGFVIETVSDSFDPDVAVFMDFRIDQSGEVRFLYVLPESKRKALVEVAIFSNNMLEQKDYDKILSGYITDYLRISNYDILEKEFGVIPMTPYPFHKHNTNRVTNIGTSGGMVKASSGYAFKRVQQHSEQLIKCITKNKPMSDSYKGLMGRHAFFDKVMLHAMLKGGVSGDRFFSDLFGKKSAQQIFKFLDHETTILEELNIFTAPPFWPFTKAFFKEII